MPSQRFTDAEIKCIYYGKAYVLNSDKFPEKINKIVEEEANKLAKK